MWCNKKHLHEKKHLDNKWIKSMKNQSINSIYTSNPNLQLQLDTVEETGPFKECYEPFGIKQGSSKVDVAWHLRDLFAESGPIEVPFEFQGAKNWLVAFFGRECCTNDIIGPCHAFMTHDYWEHSMTHNCEVIGSWVHNSQPDELIETCGVQEKYCKYWL